MKLKVVPVKSAVGQAFVQKISVLVIYNPKALFFKEVELDPYIQAWLIR